VIGTSDAQACYEAATFNPTIADDASCNAAIKRGKLSRPQLAATYSNRGIILANHGELDKAIEDQNAAIALDPDSARAHVNAQCHYRWQPHTTKRRRLQPGDHVVTRHWQRRTSTAEIAPCTRDRRGAQDSRRCSRRNRYMPIGLAPAT
jgi:tetratricopeptide (TPR) repeat protein